jgi:universal stress protein E
MHKITRVIVANDSLEGMESALAKAAMIEHYTGAEVRAMTVIYDAVAEEPEEILPEEQRVQLVEALKAAERHGLRNLTEPYQTKVAEMDAQVLWSKQPKDAILDAVAKSGAELLIKPVSEHHPLGDYVHTPLDWMLMREAPCAVLVSRRASWGKPTCVLAAIDVTDVRHLALTRAVLTTAATLARVLGVPLHLATAYPNLGQQEAGDLQVAMDYAGIKADMRENRRAALEHWIATLGLEVAETHLLEGKPAVVIPELANRLEATLTVLGTAARTGLVKLLIGNTAEDMIGRIRGDLVTVREPWS